MARGLDGGHGDGEAEGGAGAEAALDGDLSTEGLDEAANQCEAESGAFAGAAGGVEAAEDLWQSFRLDAAAAVANEELDAVFDLFGAEQDRAFGRRVTDGVAEQVVEDAAQGAAVGVDVGEIGEGLDLDLDPFGAGLLDPAVSGPPARRRWGAAARS